MEVRFESGRNGDVLARVDGLVCFPARRGPLPKAGEVWDCALEGKNPKGTVGFLRLLKRTEARWVRFTTGVFYKGYPDNRPGYREPGEWVSVWHGHTMPEELTGANKEDWLTAQASFDKERAETVALAVAIEDAVAQGVRAPEIPAEPPEPSAVTFGPVGKLADGTEVYPGYKEAGVFKFCGMESGGVYESPDGFGMREDSHPVYRPVDATSELLKAAAEWQKAYWAYVEARREYDPAHSRWDAAVRGIIQDSKHPKLTKALIELEADGGKILSVEPVIALAKDWGDHGTHMWVRVKTTNTDTGITLYA